MRQRARAHPLVREDRGQVVIAHPAERVGQPARRHPRPRPGPQRGKGAAQPELRRDPQPRVPAAMLWQQEPHLHLVLVIAPRPQPDHAGQLVLAVERAQAGQPGGKAQRLHLGRGIDPLPRRRQRAQRRRVQGLHPVSGGHVRQLRARLRDDRIAVKRGHARCLRRAGENIGERAEHPQQLDRLYRRQGGASVRGERTLTEQS